MPTTRKRSAASTWLAVEAIVPVALLFALIAPARAQAQPSPPPWHQGVPEERKQRARALFSEGRELHRQLMLGEARAKYEEALSEWEHPQIRFYLGKVLRRMGLLLLAYESLQKALRWGPGSLD